MNTSDAGILKIYQHNKYQGLELLYGRYKKYVYTLAYHYAGNKEDALDLTHEVFVSILKSLDSFKTEFSLLPWIKRITINKCLNFIRDKKVSISLNQASEDELELQDLVHSKENTEDTIVFQDTQQALSKAISLLPPQERMAVILRHFKGMKYEEIAKVMALPLSTVKNSLHRARKTMKVNLENDGLREG